MELLERGTLLLELSALLAEADGGRGRLAFVGGEAGIGKTVLVRRFAELVRDRAPLLVGGCDPLSTPRPLGPLLDVADRLPGAPLRLAAGKDSLYGDLLAALAKGPRPVVLVFEDLHWADEATLDLVRFLARRIDGLPALLIATYRDDEVGDLHPLRRVLGDVATAPGVRRMALAPLSVAAVRALAAESGVDPDALHRHTGGNPFFVTEVLAAGGASVPPTVRDAVLARAARLAAPAREVLTAAAVIGFRSEPWLLDKVAGGSPEATDACLAAGMLVDQEGAYAFRHELTREAVLGTVAPRRRVELNRRVLDALSASPHPVEPARLAHHAEEAGDAAAVLEHAAEAGRRASALASHREAAAQYARALRHADGLSPPERIALLQRFAFEAVVVDRYEDAVAANREIIALAREAGDPRKEGEALAYLAGFLVALGRNGEAEAASRDALERLEPLGPGRELAAAYAWQAALRMLNRDSAEAVVWARRALAIAEPAGLTEIAVHASSRLGAALLMMGDEAGVAELEGTLERAEAAGLHQYAALAYGNLGSGLGELHDFARAERYLREGMEYAAAREIDGTHGYMRAWYALVLLHLGRWDEADAVSADMLARPRTAGITRITALLARGRLLSRRGDPHAGEVLDETLAHVLPTGTLQRVGPARIARAEAAWLAGDHGRARDEAGAALELALEKRHAWMAGELLFWLAQAGEAVRVPSWIAAPFALQLAGDWAGAARSWWERGCPYEAAQALALGDDPAGVLRAVGELDRLGAEPAAARARRRLRELGVRGVPRGPRPSTRGHPAGLTRREAEVAALLAEGLRNADIAKRLFLSPKTVDHHVSRVLGKLGVHTRGEAALALRQTGEAAPPR